jgi:KUP system potassium uptake protein
MMTQLSLKKGLERFGDAGAEAVSEELKQLHDRAAMVPKGANMLTKEEKRGALQYLMYLKKKRCGRIKGRGCADGRKQRVYKTKEESSSPTVAIESLFLTAVIDAKEKRYVATCDIPGAFLHADMDEVVHMHIDGPLAKLLVNIDSKLYEPYLTMEGNKPVIYVKLEKALYGTLQASLLFWKNLSGYLIEQGFALNPYDECVANKIINGKQCTIVWHVDDLKISHEDSAVTQSIVALLQEKYGSEDAPVTVTYGKVHDYLGMTLNYSKTGKVIINMTRYVTDLLNNVPEDMWEGISATPAAGHLYEVNSSAELLDKFMSEKFHTLTAKLLFLSKRARPDLQQAVGFLTTRVKNPDVDDWKKLKRVIQYLRGSQDLNLTLEADSTHVIKWWVDAAFAVHRDMRSQTGMTMTLGKGSVYASSLRQKINTRSSTEAELVGVDDAMGMILWTRLFLENQGYEVRNTKIYQDNQSAALMERNGKRSSTKRTRHINIRYFFITDYIKDGALHVEYCPTEHMLADIFTKPLQGNAFRKFRDAILNTHSSGADSFTCSASES